MPEQRVPLVKVLIAIGAIVVIAAFGLVCVMSVFAAEREIRLDDTALTTTATTVAVDHDDSSDSGPTTTVDVRFRLLHHEDRVGLATVTYDRNLARHRGDTVRISYDPDDPSTARPAGEDSTEAVAQAAVLTGMLLCVPLAAWFWLRWRRKHGPHRLDGATGE